MYKRSPKYYIIKQALIQMINNEQLLPEQLVPSETKLMQQYDVSRITVRKALEELSVEGYLYKVQGKGTFVKGSPLSQTIEKVRSYTEEIVRLGMAPSRKIIAASLAPADSKRSRALGVNLNDLLYVLKRVYYADDAPLCLTTAYLPQQYFPGIDAIDFAAYSLYDILENRYQCKITRSSLDIEAVAANEDICAYLGLQKRTPILLFRSVTYGMINGKEIPIEYFKTYYLTNKIRYTLEQLR